MEILVGITLVILALNILFRGLTDFVKQLHTSKPKGLLSDGKKLNFNLTISSDNRKKEACAANTNSKRDDLD